MDTTLKLLVLGAHPDDADAHAGGLIARYRKLGHAVKLVSVTNGAAGHHQIGADDLAALRRNEAAAAGRVVGAAYEVWNFPDGHLVNTLDLRNRIIAEIRRFAPDLVLTHRTCDYHPDHRYTSQLVMDSAYVVTVPNDCADTPAMKTNPVIGYFADRFRKPCPFEPTVAIDISSVIARKFDALHCHQSQQYEWLPYNKGQLDQVPADDKGRRQWLFEQRSGWDAQLAEKYRPLLIERYGPQRGPAVKYAEAFEGCEYGTPMNQTQIQRLFAGL